MSHTDFSEAFAQRHGMPRSFVETSAPCFVAVAEAVRDSAAGTPIVIGISGGQGCGKSTLSAFIHEWLSAKASLRVAAFSLDDCYLPRATREQLAHSVHPLLITRGPPGTHDLPLAHNTLEQLRHSDTTSRVALPRFDKASDDRVAQADWPVCKGAVDVVLFDGWLLGCQAVAESALEPACNALEREQDGEGQWRRYTNEQLHAYQSLWHEIDLLIALRAPSFEQTQSWRFAAERQLSATRSGPDLRYRSMQDIERFMQHFERFSVRLAASLSERADIDIELDAQHNIKKLRLP